MKKKALIEAALFMAEDPLSLKKLSKIAGISTKEVKDILDEIRKDFNSSSRGIELALIGDNYQIQVKDQFLDKVSDLTTYSDISRGALRTLSIVALHQPILQSQIVKIQGNKTYNYIKDLERRGLIKTERVSRTKSIATTKEFERYFGKNLEEIRDRLKSDETGLEKDLNA